MATKDKPSKSLKYDADRPPEGAEAIALEAAAKAEAEKPTWLYNVIGGCSILLGFVWAVLTVVVKTEGATGLTYSLNLLKLFSFSGGLAGVFVFVGAFVIWLGRPDSTITLRRR